jgi:integrase
MKTSHRSAMIRNEARSLPFAEWPEAERIAWDTAVKAMRRISPSRPRLCEKTCNDLAQRYGQFLNYCKRTCRLEQGADPGALVRPTAIAGFVAELQSRVRPVTVAQSIYKVCRAARLIAPALDYAWLSELAKDLALVAEPMNKTARVVTTERLVEAGLTLVVEAGLSTKSLLARSLMARNGLMIALLGVCPIRLKNLHALKIGRSFVKHEGTWWIVLRDTKSRRPDERPVPDYLNSAIEYYLEIYRPILLRGKSSDALWIGRLGRTLSYLAVQGAVCQTTRETIGVDVSPHLFRASAATTAALHAADMPNLASALLHHRDSAVTEEHYNRASSLSVARQFARIVRSL